jgi:hypothetical protein
LQLERFLRSAFEPALDVGRRQQENRHGLVVDRLDDAVGRGGQERIELVPS